ncbi:MAG: phosphonate C-P lyase system protein PhnG [Methylotenera sp.]|nr:phosphonate C-P lyase system protein PhnG [Methylotenera sp.]MDD4926408.1 phosphonate C-P lyase system protein PhnG [Methylotenera sp.]NOU39707.1 phosphonate C-P lyase system protein PhnG [Methylotenera sp.]
MNQTLNKTSQRSQWPRQLMAVPAAEVIAAAATLASQHRVEDVTLPQAGLALMQLRDSALNEAYYPGEIPLASARVILTSADGTQHEGAAQVMHDSATFARAVAVIDAALAANLPGSEVVAPLLNRGAALLAQQSVTRKKMLARTRVDFALLGTTDEEDGDE